MELGTRLSRALWPFAAVVLLGISVVLRVWAQPSNHFQIVSVRLQDELGNVASSFPRGRFIMVNATIENIIPYSQTRERFLLLTRMTSSDTMWGLGAFASSLAPGETVSAAPGIVIPTGAPTGGYSMTIFLWSNWASAGGVPVAESVQVAFTVTP